MSVCVRARVCVRACVTLCVLLQCALHSIDGHSLAGIASSELRQLVKQVMTAISFLY